MPNEDLTPMLSQYHHFKRLYPDCLLFFRLGDFYELFYEDATIGSKELGIVLTSRPTGKGRERISMCGVPYHSSFSYISKLVSRGYKVAICEQVEDSSQAKGLVKRDVIRVITPGTYFEKDISGLACVYKKGNTYFCAYINLTTGEFLSGSFNEEQSYEFLAKFSPKELILPRGLEYKFDKLIASFKTEVDEDCFSDGLKELKRDFGVYSSRALGFDKEEQLLPCGCVYVYVKRTQKGFLPFLNKPKPYTDEGYVRIDYKARRGLELIESWEGREELSLFGVIDRTLTPMGRRKLKFHILHPFRKREKIEQLQSAVEELKNKVKVLYEVRKHLDQIPDMEKIISKISGNLAKPKDFILLKRALFSLDRLKESLRKGGLSSSLLVDLTEKVEDTKDVAQYIDDVLVQDPPIHLKEGGLIRDGVNDRLDELRNVLKNGEKLIKEYEDRLREETSIQSLKIGYNKVIGYYIEVTKPNIKHVPLHFKRRQTLSNAERFTTDELVSLEEKVISAQARSRELEYEIFIKLRERVLENIERIAKNAHVLSMLDYVQSLAYLALEKGWKKPTVVDDKVLEIKEGRHPVIEAYVKDFTPNGTCMDGENLIMVITGPNMAGKSSYIRQVAILTILAHMGSFLPCDEARIGLTSSIHARIGSGDILALGVSTFMNEMLDVASILNNADEKSLIVLDEVGRGTSTYDGIALTQAIIEHIANKVKARTLLATHYLEITKIEDNFPCVKNYHMAVSKEGDSINFLYKLMRGSSEGSFGLQVAKMANLPKELIERAKEILEDYQRGNLSYLEKVYIKSVEDDQRRLEQETLNLIESIDIANTTPIKALLLLSELKERIRSVKKSTLGGLP